MLRVSPDGKYVWVQTAGTNANTVLDADTLETIATTPTGRGPVRNAFPLGDGPYALVTHTGEPFVLVLDRETGAEVTRIDVGGPQSTVSFAPDGRTAFVALRDRDEVVAIDMAELAIAARIPTSPRPFGLVLLQM
jgi:YVTN family beta-propeller protein